MSLVIEVSDEVLARLEVVATARGITVEQLASEALSSVAVVDPAFTSLVAETVDEHREILDRLAAT